MNRRPVLLRAAASILVLISTAIASGEGLDDKLVELMRLPKALLRIREDVPKPAAYDAHRVRERFHKRTFS